MDIIKFEITMRGTRPLLMHSSVLANPLDPNAKALKAVTSKRSKTDSDHQEIARLEYIGSMYFDEVGPYLPGENIARALVDGARVHKLGVKVTRGVFIETDINPLAYKGPRDIRALWADENFRHMASVKVGTVRTMRCRPMFQQWSVSATGTLDLAVMNLAELRAVALTAGQLIGVGDWRPRFGRFACTVEEIT